MGNSDVIEIHRIGAETMLVPIVGTSPLMMHRFSEKAKKQMLDNMQGRKSPKENKNPEAEYEAAFHRIKGETDAFGFPVTGFKAATVGAARFYSGVTMVQLRQFLFFSGVLSTDGEMLARIEGTPQMREDVVRVARGGTDLRYRPIFNEWSSVLKVTYVQSALTKNSVLSLIDAGGMGVGVGEWRPEKGGVYGTYAIDQTKEIEVIS